MTDFMTSTKILRLALAGLMALTAAACSTKDPDVYIARDVEVLYNLGMDNLERRRHGIAAVAFDEVERQHPYSSWARKAQLMSAYSYYMANKYEDAILSSERFLSLHPGNAWAPYANYLIALCHYEQIIDVGRDQRVTEQALGALEKIISRYPDTEYSRDANLKRDLVLDHLAGKEMEVGRFYLNQAKYLAAIGRFRNVIDRYQTTTHVPEAMHRLVESYYALGILKEAQSSAATLGYNYPGSRWYRYSYELLEGVDLGADGDANKSPWYKRIFGS